MKRKNNKGFTLVELLVTMAIVSIILGIVGTLVISSINNSKAKSEMIALNNIKASANTYVKEFSTDVVWKPESASDKYSCVSVQALIDKGYFKAEEMADYSNEFVKVVADEYNNVIYEKIADGNDACSEFYQKIEVPTSKDLCYNDPYAGKFQDLFDVNKVDVGAVFSLDGTNYSTDSIQGKDAGSYKIYFKLEDGYAWSDGTREDKEITCAIKKAKIEKLLKVSPSFIDDPVVGKRTITLTSPVDGKVYVKSSDLKYATIDKFENDNNNVSANGVKNIDINILAARKTTTYVTITVVPTGEYNNNYYTGSYVFNIGEIERTEVEIPKGTPLEPTPDIPEDEIIPDAENYCKNLPYTGNLLTITKEPGSLDGETSETAGYTFYDNQKVNIGIYTVTAKLKYGYVWSDGTTEDKTITCEIREPIVKVSYKEINKSTYVIEDVTECTTKDAWYLKKYGEYGGSLCIPTRVGYTFNGWFKDTNYTIPAITNDTIVENHKDHSIYANWPANTYTVKYNGNGNTGGSTASSSHTYDTAKNLTANGFTKSGYTFAGWNTKADGTGTAYVDKASVTNLTSTNGGTVNLYAQWKKEITLTLIYYNNNATAKTYTETKAVYNSTTSASFTIPSSIASKTYSKSSECGSWKNLGWSTGTGAKDSVSYSKGATLTLSSSTTLYARYQKEVIFTYDYNAGSYVPSRYEYMNRNASGKSSNLGGWTETVQRYKTENGVTYDHYVKRSGYKLEGWAYDKNGDSYIIKRVSWDVGDNPKVSVSFDCNGRSIHAIWKDA